MGVCLVVKIWVVLATNLVPALPVAQRCAWMDCVHPSTPMIPMRKYFKLILLGSDLLNGNPDADVF